MEFGHPTLQMATPVPRSSCHFAIPKSSYMYILFIRFIKHLSKILFIVNLLFTHPQDAVRKAWPTRLVRSSGSDGRTAACSHRWRLLLWSADQGDITMVMQSYHQFIIYNVDGWIIKHTISALLSIMIKPATKMWYARITCIIKRTPASPPPPQKKEANIAYKKIKLIVLNSFIANYSDKTLWCEAGNDFPIMYQEAPHHALSK